MVGAGLAAMGFARVRAGKAREDRHEAAGVGAWLALALVLAGWQLASYLQHPRRDHPTLSSLTNAVLETHAARTVAFVGWVWAAARLARQ